MFVSLGAEGMYTKEYLGGKGYGLWQLKQAGIPVPPALILPIPHCIDYRKDPKEVMARIKLELGQVAFYFTTAVGYMPLLAVRSGAKDSMPGMMDTILNVGITPDNIMEWKDRLGLACIEDCVERFRAMYGKVVLGDANAMLPSSKMQLPSWEKQLLGAIEAVFKSWDNERAVTYRNLNGIPHDGGTAVVLQAMVFGHLNEQSCTGVLFTRDVDTGDHHFKGEWLPQAQGEDLVAGVRTPESIETMDLKGFAVARNQLGKYALALEKSHKNALDIEFTVENGTLYLLQIRPAKRSAKAAVKIAMDMVDEGLITNMDARKLVTRRELFLAQQPMIKPGFSKKPAYTGIPASSGVAVGKVVFSAQHAIDCAEPCILVTEETNPDDIAGMNAARGVVTMKGGYTCHAAVVARGMNKPAVVGLGKHLNLFIPGELLSIDGESGRVWKGKVPVVEASTDLTDSFLSMIGEGEAIPEGFCPKGAQTVVLNAVEFMTLHDMEGLRKVLERLNDKGVAVLLTGLTSSPAHSSFYDMMGDAVAPVQTVAEAVGDCNVRSIESVHTLDQLLAAVDPVIWDGAMNALVANALRLKAKAGELAATRVPVPNCPQLVSRAQLISLLS